MFERDPRGPERDEIAACSDAATLALWYRDAVETAEVIRAQISGNRDAGVAEDIWLKRAGKKLGYLKISAKWVELRMLHLELPVPYLPSDPRQEELRRKDAVIRRLHAALHAAGVAIPGEGA